MACEFINKGRNHICITDIGGIKAVGFMPYNKNLTLTVDDTFEGTGLTGSIYRWEVNNNGCNYSEEGASDEQTGVSLVSGVLTLVLPILDKDTRNQISLLSKNRCQIFVERNNGTVNLIGYGRGAYLNSRKLDIAGELTGMSGFTLTFNTKEAKEMIFLGATGINAYNAAIVTTGAINPS